MSSNLHIFIFPWLKCHWLWRSTMKNVTPDGPLIHCWPLRGQKRATKVEGGEINGCLLARIKETRWTVSNANILKKKTHSKSKNQIQCFFFVFLQNIQVKGRKSNYVMQRKNIYIDVVNQRESIHPSAVWSHGCPFTVRCCCAYYACNTRFKLLAYCSSSCAWFDMA